VPLPAADAVHMFAVEVDRTSGLKHQRTDPPTRLGSNVAMEVPAPQESVRSAAVVTVPCVHVGEGACRIAAFKRDYHIADVVAGCGKCVAESDGYRAGHLCSGNICCVRVVIDDRIGSEKFSDAVGIVPVETFAVGINKFGDSLTINELLYGGVQIHSPGQFLSGH